MKTTTTTLMVLSASATVTFMCSYFMELTMNNFEQYLAIVACTFMDGFFGIIAGVKREGFKTYKALKVIKTLFFWIAMLTLILMVEKGFAGTSWLSETIVVPFMVFQLMSVLKNASMAGFITSRELNYLMDKIDKHKGERE